MRHAVTRAIMQCCHERNKTVCGDSRNRDIVYAVDDVVADSYANGYNGGACARQPAVSYMLMR